MICVPGTDQISYLGKSYSAWKIVLYFAVIDVKKEGKEILAH